MRRNMYYYAVILCILLISLIRAEEMYFIDNEHMQRYNGRNGKWVEVHSLKQLKQLAEQFGACLDDVYAINNLSEKQFKKNYYFIPYSDVYIQQLMEKGIVLQPISISYHEFIWPIGDPKKITSGLGRRWGKFHPGVDIPAPKGTIVRAAMEGKVIFSGYVGNYGNTITILHRDNYITRYAHNYVNFVKVGDYVQKGQVIALVGSTGRSTGNHLHFEIRIDDIPLNPLDILPEKEIVVLKNPK